MYRKRKLSDVDMDALKHELREELTRDIFAMLSQHGVNFVLPTNTLPSIASDAICNNVQLDIPGGISYPNPVDFLGEPTICILLSNTGGHLVEVARGKVFPKQTVLYEVPVQDGYVVVLVNFVYPEHENFVLTPPPTNEVTTLGGAMYHRVQWRKDDILIFPKEVSTNSSLGHTWAGSSAKWSLKDLGSSSQDENVKGAPTVGNCASKVHVEGKKQTNKSTRGKAGSSVASRAPKSNTKRGQQVGVKQQ
jgi:hypothetical protein